MNWPRWWLLWCLLVPALAGAEPRFALREGMRCGHCHVNKTGGGMRTPFGVMYGQTNLPTFRLPRVVDPRMGDYLAMGANLRLSHLTRFAAHTELAGVRRSAPESNSFEIPEGNLFIRADVIPGWLTLYVDETVAPEGASNREAFILVTGLPAGGYIKAGRFLLPYGLRIPDDDAFIRRETGFTYANQDLGLELGISVHPFSMAVAVSNGSLSGGDPDPFKQVTVTTELAWAWGRFGASFAYNKARADGTESASYTAGAHLGFRLGRFGLLGELDWVRGENDAGTYDQLSGYAALEYEATKGLFVRFAFEGNDPLLSLDNNERDRFTVELSWFPIQMLEVRLRYRINRDIPQRPAENADELLFQLHGFL